MNSVSGALSFSPHVHILSDTSPLRALRPTVSSNFSSGNHLEITTQASDRVVFFLDPVFFFGPEPAQKTFLRKPGIACRNAGGKSGIANLQPLPTHLEYPIPNVSGIATPPFLLYHDHNLHNGRRSCVRRRRKRPHDTEVGITLTEWHYSCERPTEGAPSWNPVF